MNEKEFIFRAEITNLYLEEVQMQCGFHAAREHTDFCVQCETPLCSTCVQRLDRQQFCIHCYAPRVRRRERFRMVAITLLVPLLMGIAYLFFSSQAELNQARVRYGKDAESIFRLQTILDREPCNLTAGAEAIQFLSQSNNHREALRIAEDQTDKCPTTASALIVRFFAERLSADHRSSLDTADRLVRNFPHRPEGFAYRGLAYISLSRLESAADDFYRALALNPRLLDVPMNLANTLELLDRPCEAAEPLAQALTFYPGLENRFELELRIRRLRRQGDCIMESLPADVVKVPFDRTGEVMVVEAEVNGKHPARFIVDTGASSVVVTAELAAKAGLTSELKTSPVYVQTAGGVVDAYPSKLKALDVGGAEVKDLSVLVCETMGNDFDGLLGVNFLNRFNISLNPDTGVILFRGRDGTPVDPVETFKSVGGNRVETFGPGSR